MDFLQALILSLVEGVTEFLPISSTAHLLFTSRILQIPQTDFVKSFEVIIQLGAIMAVVLMYWKKLFQGFDLWKKIIVAFLPVAFIALPIYKVIKGVFFENLLIPIFAILIGGIFLIVVEKFHKEKDEHVDSIEKLTLKQAFLIGVAQSFSIVPGTSRAAATIIGGLLVGAKRKVAVEFSFLLAIPTMFAATALDLLKSNLTFSSQEVFLLAIGLIGSFLTALLVIKWFIQFVQKNSFFWFGIYRIVLALLLLAFLR